MALFSIYNDPSFIDLSLDSRSISFENPTGNRGSGGKTYGGRKGSHSKILEPGEKIVLADISGPGTIRHIWMTFPPMKPEFMRAVWMEAYYDDSSFPGISVPCLDFFGLPHGRPASLNSAAISVQEGRGFNAYLPIPFKNKIRIELTNSTSRKVPLYYQIDYTLYPDFPENTGYLHTSFRRENPTRMKQDFVIADGFEGPGRFFGCVVGIRILDKAQMWYGEGEVKMYIDEDGQFPTICGTGLEDYVGSAWGMDSHIAFMAGVPLVVKNPELQDPNPDFVSFYRWHLPDSIIFKEKIKVTIQQIGFTAIPKGSEEIIKKLETAGQIAGRGLNFSGNPSFMASGIVEREDDYCATAFVYLKKPQAVPQLDLKSVICDIKRLPYEKPSSFETLLEMMQ